MDESREGIEYQREIDEALASQMSPEEEEVVLKELEALQKEQMVGLAAVTSKKLTPARDPRRAHVQSGAPAGRADKGADRGRACTAG